MCLDFAYRGVSPCLCPAEEEFGNSLKEGEVGVQKISRGMVEVAMYLVDAT